MSIPELVIVLAVVVAAAGVVYPASRICARLGFPPALGLLAIVPVANVALLWFVAASQWPIERTHVS
ncbi:MAG: hypothetical protein U0Q12_22130 [Vicinamibacterales bacterium]